MTTLHDIIISGIIATILITMTGILLGSVPIIGIGFFLLLVIGIFSACL